MNSKASRPFSPQRVLFACLVLALLFHNVEAFTSIYPCLKVDSSLSFSSSDDSNDLEYSKSEVQEMDALIVSISKEPSDDSRRQRLSSTFEAELAKKDCKRFTFLFDQVLTIVGDRVQAKAKKKALEIMQQQDEMTNGDDDNNDSSDHDGDENNKDKGDFMGMDKSDEEKQLWALVDMMVQSKTLAKKASGELGSKGTLQ